MHEGHADAQDPRETTPEDHEAPALTDIGSFEELTQFNPSNITDTEGSS